jgi:hypothetical protein
MRACDDDDADWAMVECGYTARFWENRATGKAREARELSYIGEFSRGGATYRMAPLSLSWLAADGAEESIARPVTGIDAVLDADGYSITWPDAFGKGLDYGYNTRPDHFFKALTVRDRKALPDPKRLRPTHLVLRLWVSWDGAGAPDNGLPAVAAEYRGSKGSITRHTPQTRYAHTRADGRECFWLREPEAWDSAEEPRRWQLEWWYETRGKEVVLALALPVEALESAQYPLVMDTAIDEEQVGASTDDGYSSGSTYPGYASVGLVQYMVYMGRGYNIWYTSGFRFTVPLAQGMAITSAALSLRAYATRSDDIDVHWYCEDSDDSSSFSTDNMPGGTVYNNRTSATVHWELTTDVAGGTWYTTPDVSALVEEVVTRAGWSSGSGMSFIAVADAEHPNYKYLTWSSYDGGYGAKLNVSYSVPALKAYPGVAASSPAAHAPARTPGAVASLSAIAQSTPTAYVTTAGGVQSADAAWAQRTPTAWVPVRLPGAVVALPGIAQGTATALDGTALPGTALALPALAQVLAQGYDSAAAPGAITAIAALAQSVGAAYVPGATPGAVVVLPGIAQGTATALDGVALPGTVAIAAGIAQAIAEAYAAGAVPGAVVVLPGRAETVAQGYDPAAAAGAVTAIAALAQSVGAAYVPGATPGAVVVLPGLAQSVALGYNTAAAPGVVTALAGIGLHDPAAYGAVAAGAAAIALPGRAVSQAWGYAPTALPGLVWVIADAALHVGYAYDVIMGVQMPAEGLLVIGCTGLDVDATARALLARSETELQVDGTAWQRMARR